MVTTNVAGKFSRLGVQQVRWEIEASEANQAI